MRSLTNVATADAYTAATTIEQRGIVRVNLQVFNAAIRYQLGAGWPGVVWGPETFLGPSLASLDRRATGIRVRSAAAGVPAQVTVDAVTEDDLPAGES